MLVCGHTCVICSEISKFFIFKIKIKMDTLETSSFSFFSFLNTTTNTHTHAYLHTHRKHATVGEKKGGRRKGGTETLLTIKKSHVLLLLSVLLFSLLSLLSLLLYFLLICILSYASLASSLWPLGAASSSADVPALLLPSARWRLSIANQMFFFFHPLFWDGGCARFTVATVGWCFRSHYSGPLMTLK